MSALSFVDAVGKTQRVCGWTWQTEALWSHTNPIWQQSFNCSSSKASLFPAEHLFQRCCLLLMMSVGADLCFGDLIWKFKLCFGSIFLFCMTFENAEGYIQWKCKTNPSFAVKLRRSLTLIKNDPAFFFWLGSVLTQTWMFSFCSWDQVVTFRRFLVSVISACSAVMEFLCLVCAAPVSALSWQLWVGCFGWSSLADPKLCRSAHSKSLLCSLFWFWGCSFWLSGFLCDMK